MSLPPAAVEPLHRHAGADHLPNRLSLGGREPAHLALGFRPHRYAQPPAQRIGDELDDGPGPLHGLGAQAAPGQPMGRDVPTERSMPISVVFGMPRWSAICW